MAHLDDSVVRLPFVAELGPSPLSMGDGCESSMDEQRGVDVRVRERGYMRKIRNVIAIQILL